VACRRARVRKRHDGRDDHQSFMTTRSNRPASHLPSGDLAFPITSSRWVDSGWPAGSVRGRRISEERWERAIPVAGHQPAEDSGATGRSPQGVTYARFAPDSQRISLPSRLSNESNFRAGTPVRKNASRLTGKPGNCIYTAVEIVRVLLLGGRTLVGPCRQYGT
jgi:hypothetical protein